MLHSRSRTGGSGVQSRSHVARPIAAWSFWIHMFGHPIEVCALAANGLVELVAFSPFLFLSFIYMDFNANPKTEIRSLSLAN